MKILFLNGSAILDKKGTGVTNYYNNLINGLSKIKTIEYDIASFNHGISINNYKPEIKNHIRFVRKGFNKYSKYFLPIEFLFGKYDIYICDGWLPIVFSKAKTLAIVHDLMSIIYPSNYKLRTKLYLQKYFKSLKKVDKIIAVSNSTKNDLVKYYNINSDKISVVYPIVSFKNINIRNSKTQGIDYEKKYLFYIGDMRKNKNLYRALKGYKLYIDKNNDSDLMFYIAGKKDFEYKLLYNYICKYNLKNRVIFLGYISEEQKLLLYKNAYAFLFVSLYEGFGIPIVEAMHMNTPIITSNTSSMREIGINCCLLVNPKNISKISKSIKKIGDIDIRKKLKTNSIQRIHKFSEEKGVEDFIKILNRI